MRAKRAGLGNMVMWLASGTRARAAWSLSLYEIGAGATRSGNAVQNAGVAAQAGKALATVNDKSEWGGLDYLAADAMVAEERVKDREFRLKDTADDDTPGMEPWRVNENIRPAKPLEALIARAAKVGPGFENEHVAFPARARLIAHHRPDDPPINSSPVFDPGDGSRDDWQAGLQGPVRVRPWLESFCAALPDPRETGTDFEEPADMFALLLNATRSGGDNSGWLGAHFAQAEAVLSAEAFGFAHPADDGYHNLGLPRLGLPVMEGGLEAFRTKFGSRGSLLYSPLAMSPEQWPNPPKSINPVLTEIREDYNDTHSTHCGTAPGYKKLVTWIPIFDFGPPTVIEPPQPKPEPKPRPKYPGIIKVPFEGEDTGPNPFGGSGGGGGIPASLSGDDFWDGNGPGVDDLRGDYPAAGVVASRNFGERAASVLSQFEATSIQYRARPALPDGQLTLRMLGTSEIDHLAGLMYGYTVRDAFEQPVVADDVASPNYKYASPRAVDTPNERWPASLSSAAELVFNESGVLTGKDPARGGGSVMLMPSNAPVDWMYAENKERWSGTINDLTRIIMAGKNSAGVIADGRFGLGLRSLQSGRIVSGFEFKLDTSTSATEPDLVLSPKNASGAESGAGVFHVQTGVQVDDYLLAGAVGTEADAIRIDNTTTRGRIRASDFGTKAAHIIAHQHSTTVAPKLYLSRSNSDSSSHTAVTNSQELGSVVALGWAHSTPGYLPAAQIKMSVDSGGTVGSGSMPGKIELQTTRDSAKTPTTAVLIDSAQTVFVRQPSSTAPVTVIESAASDGVRRETYLSRATTLSAGVTPVNVLTLAPTEVCRLRVSITAAEESGGTDHDYAYEALLKVTEVSGALSIGTAAVLLNDGSAAFAITYADGGSGVLQINVDDTGAYNMLWNIIIEVDRNTRV